MILSTQAQQYVVLTYNLSSVSLLVIASFGSNILFHDSLKDIQIKDETFYHIDDYFRIHSKKLNYSVLE